MGGEAAQFAQHNFVGDLPIPGRRAPHEEVGKYTGKRLDARKMSPELRGSEVLTLEM